ncbi:MAG: NAD(P)/FAD-dependent oxidoreductase, partial [Nanoarchaeota archaeon]
MEHTGITIIGAGIVGLAIASELSKKREIVVIEKHERAGKEISSRNSEIIHSGLYYKKDSLKAKLCVEGKNLLYELCERFNIPHRRTGKLIVAANIAEIPCLERLLAQGQENGVLDLELLTRTQAGRLEPNVNTCGALFSKSTGIVDIHKLMDLFQFQATSNESIIAYNSEVTGIEKSPSGYVLQIKSGTETCHLASQVVINSAGLHADKLAELAGIDIKASRYKIHFCKGEYFIVRNAKDRIRHLIYPLPEENLRGLGIHATLDLDGELRLGPNAFYVDVIDY